MSKTHLLDPSWLARLERMQVAVRKAAGGNQAGKRRSRQLGSSMEFADYRPYVPGDDLRRLDWNAYARSGKLFLKKFWDETQLHVSLYIDCSRSMDFGQPRKLDLAVRLAAALGYMSLCHLDRVSVYAFDRQILGSLRGMQGKGNSLRLMQFLAGLSPGGAGDLDQALRSPGALQGRAGISIVLSDFLFDSGCERAIARLQAARQEVTLVQILSQEELSPAYQGELRLIDSETGLAKEVSVTEKLLQEYRNSVTSFRRQLAGFAYGRGVSCVFAQPELPLETTLFSVLRQAGVIR